MPSLNTIPGESLAAVFLKARRIIVAAAALGLLAGCQDPAPTYNQAFGFQCANHHSKFADAMCNKSHDPGTAKVSRFCYKSLADTNCFDQPDPNRYTETQGSPG